MIGSILLGALGAALTAVVLWDAFETVLVPRRIGRRFRLTRTFYRITWAAWSRFARSLRSTPRREAALGFYGPLSLIVLLMIWAGGMIVGFALLQIAVAGNAHERLGTALYMSGETFFTLGFGDITPSTTVGRWLAVIEAGMGFGFLGTVVGYLPTLYSAFSQREIEISLLDARAGSPPTAAEFLFRGSRGGGPELRDTTLRDWERWSAQLLETHISYPQLAYYRSQHLNQSWLGALTAILDSCTLLLSANDGSASRQVELTFAMSRHALVDVTQIFVTHLPPERVDRLPADELLRVRDLLAKAEIHLPSSAEFEARLDEKRRLYEPYAQALADHLLFQLPPWTHRESRRDNWRGGPWDHALARQSAPAHRADEHF